MKNPDLTYRQEIYQPEITVKLRLHIISVVVFACIIIFTIAILSVMRHNLNKTTLKYLDYHINYIAENNLMNSYAEIDDMVQIITSNPYIGKKQTNGADALWEYCSYNTEERKDEFVSRIRKTSEMLEFRERVKLDEIPDDRLAATVDNFSTEIADKAWAHNVLFFLGKSFPYYDRVSGTVLFTEHRAPHLVIYYYYTEIMAVRICRLCRQGKNNTAKELYLKTLHMSWILFNGDSLASQAAGLGSLKTLCHDDIISLGIFTENEKKHLNSLKKNLLFLLKKTETGISLNFLKPIMLTNPVIFYYPDRYNKVITVLKPHRDRKFIIPIYYEMLYAREILSILDNNSGILFPLPNDRHYKEIMRIFNPEKRLFLKRALSYTDKNMETCKTENCNPTEHSAYLKDSKLKFIYKIASEWNCRALLWYLRPFVWYECM